MVFSSLLFLYAFFPLNILFYRIAPDIKAKNWVMLIFSLIFYAWAGPIYILLLVGMTYADYLAALYIQGATRKNLRRKYLFRGCAVNLGLLCIFKYLTFFLQTSHDFFGVPEKVVQIGLPIGISFYTFQLLSYLVDVYREQVPAQRDFKTLLLYVSLFHQCIAGPIVRYETIEQELNGRVFRRSDMAGGIRRFTVGLAKKALLANTCGSLADSFLVATSGSAAEQIAVLMDKPVLSIWMGMIFYTMQIYLDFAAYSDMAIGMGNMIGFHYEENFRYPYIADSVREFWRRWHISLSSFFRDYLYIPLGGNRCHKLRVIFNLFIVWACTGLWHGASWNYVFWGLYYFVFLVMERYIVPSALMEKIPHAARHLYVLLVVSIGWMLFRFENFDVLQVALKGLVGLNGNGFTNYECNMELRGNIIFLLVAAVACTPVVIDFVHRFEARAQQKEETMRLYKVLAVLVPVFLMLLSTTVLVGDSYNPFLYFRF